MVICINISSSSGSGGGSGGGGGCGGGGSCGIVVQGSQKMPVFFLFDNP